MRRRGREIGERGGGGKERGWEGIWREKREAGEREDRNVILIWLSTTDEHKKQRRRQALTEQVRGRT